MGMIFWEKSFYEIETFFWEIKMKDFILLSVQPKS